MNDLTAFPELQIQTHKYELVVFDLDGTLYRQAPVRRAMFGDLLRHGGPPGRFERFKILYHFRKMREDIAIENPQDFDDPLFSLLAKRTGHEKHFLKALVEEWMEERPLVHLNSAAVKGARDFVAALRNCGIKVAVWSDYPVDTKLEVLGITADYKLSASDGDVNALKPDPTGLYLAMSQAGTSPSRTLMVGDRIGHDGAAATAANVDFLLRSDREPRSLGARQFYVKDFLAGKGTLEKLFQSGNLETQDR